MRILVFILLFISTVSVSQNIFELHGKVKLDGDSQKGIKIMIVKDGKPFKTIVPESNGKYSINLDYNSVYIVSYVRNKYVTKKVEVNTKVSDNILDKNDFKFKWKIDVGLFREYEGIDFGFFSNPIQKIFYVNKNKLFDYDDKYAKKIEAELKALMKEIDKKRAEEAKQAEKDKLEAEAEAKRLAKQKLEEQRIADAKKRAEEKQASKDKLKAESEAKKLAQKKLEEQKIAEEQKLAEQKQANAEKLAKKKEEEKLATQKAKEQAKIEAEKRQQDKQAKFEEEKRKREEAKVVEAKALADRLAAAQAAEEEKKAKRAKAFAEAEELKKASKAKAEAEAEERRKKFEAIKQAHQDELRRKHSENRTVKTYDKPGEKVTEITIVRDDVIDVYRKAVHNWGGIFYFKNNKSISKHIYDLETK